MRQTVFMTSQTRNWSPDVLGPPFEQCSLSLAADSEGEVTATLVRYRPSLPRRLLRVTRSLHTTDVLYIHGWSDYFFQREHAEFWHQHGARFFALDLRKYGRSLRSWQTPGYIDDLSTYDEDIAAAVALIRHRHDFSRRRLILVGHSTGGLIASLWLEGHPGEADALVLNSPWLEFQGRSAGRVALSPIVGLSARLDPKVSIPRVDLGFYSRSISNTRDGEWDYDVALRPLRGFPARPGWLRAILDGHARVAGGLNLQVPVLTLLSTRSNLAPRWNDDMMRSDVVINVDDTAVRALNLGRTVTVARIDGALHDVFLSAQPVRRVAYDQITTWLSGYFPRRRRAR